jgi:mono/diheme cytochrome c family protein
MPSQPRFTALTVPKLGTAALLTAGALLFAGPATKSPVIDAAGFEKHVKPILKNNCAGCHNAGVMSGGVNLLPYTEASTLGTDREAWDKIVQKVESGEMPPKGLPRPAQPQVAALVEFVRGEFAKADATVKPDPGRVTARRMNRNEYRNTVRDLLAVDFRAERDFPTDDSGYGFDNIGDILTVSPVLMEKYLNAAETIASRAMGADPLPKKPLEITYELKTKSIRRLDFSTVEASHRVDFDGDYTVRFGFPGERSADAKPVKMGFWMDGQLLQTIEVETKPSKLVYFNPFSDAEIRVYLPEGDHVFRAAFLNDEFIKTITDPKVAYSDKKNKFIGSMTFVGPFASKVEKASRKKILICDVKTGQACVEKIVTNLAHHAYRRPVSRGEVAGLMKFVALAKAQGQSTEQGIQLALEAMLVSPEFLFRVEKDPNPTDPEKVHRLSDVELASRLSYFLWSSMPDDELLSVAEAGKLKDSAVLDAQVKRMIADKKAASFADNFAGQWLEIRNLDSIKPDPQKFPAWTPELKDAMRTETSMFFEHVLSENRPLSDFIDARYTFLNEQLAKYYGIDDVKGPDFRRVELKTEQRGGVLSQASVLAVSSYPSRTSPTIRGKYVLNNLLGTPPPPPPPDVPALDDSKIGSDVSLRKQLEAHRNNPVCASCHSKMDVLGFGLENYDAIGKWRTMDGKFPIDVGGTMPNGKSFKTAAEMRTILTDSLPQVSRCLVEKIMTYAMGRGMQPYDNKTIDEINRKLQGEGYHFQTLIYEVVRSLPFQSRRGELVTTQKQAPQKPGTPKEIAQK